MTGGFADYRFRFVHEVGPLTPVKGYGASCLGIRKKKKETLSCVPRFIEPRQKEPQIKAG